MLGQPISMLLPQVVGFRLTGELPEGATATDLVLTVTEMLRERGVVGKFVEFFGPGISGLGLADRATIGNMSPEFGSTCAIFPVDAETLRYLEFTGRPTEQIELVDAYTPRAGPLPRRRLRGADLLATRSSSTSPRSSPASPGRSAPRTGSRSRTPRPPSSSRCAEFDPDAAEELGNRLRRGHRRDASRPPTRPAEDHNDDASKPRQGAAGRRGDGGRGPTGDAVDGRARGRHRDRARPRPRRDRRDHELHQHLEPLGDGRRRAAGQEGGRARARREALGQDLARARLDRRHRLPRAARASTSTSTSSASTSSATAARPASATPGPLPEEISKAVDENDLVVCSVLSGNRNFEGRINPDVRNNYLASPPLCVAYALAGRMDVDLTNEPLGEGSDGEPVYLRDIWPGSEEIKRTVAEAVRADMFTKSYADVFAGDERWRGARHPRGRPLHVARLDLRARAAVLRGHGRPSRSRSSRSRAPACSRVLGDSVTTDHISPAGAIKKQSPAGQWLIENGVEPARLQLVRLAARQPRGDDPRHVRERAAAQQARRQGGRLHAPLPRRRGDDDLRSGDELRGRGVPLVVLAGKEYGSGSSRDWAAKGTALLGVRAVIAESFERIHRSNLIGMGVLPLQFPDGETVESLGLTGEEVFDVGDLERRRGEDASRSPRTRDGGDAGRASRRAFASTPRTRSATSATAASCTGFCATCADHSRQPNCNDARPRVGGTKGLRVIEGT